MNREPDDMLPALRALGDSLGEAARREIDPAGAGDGARPGREPRGALGRFGRRGGVLGVLAGTVLVAAGAATAGDLISSGEPDDSTGVPADFRPATGTSEPIALRAADPAAGGAWGLRVYRSGGGYACVTAGWIRGQSLGRVEGGRFRAIAPDAPGTVNGCAGVRPDSVTWALARFAEPAQRTLVFGRAGERVQRVEVFDGERRHVARVAGGAWLLVLDENVDPLRLSVQALES